MINTPIYAAAAMFEQPVPVPTPLTVSAVSLAEIMTSPVAWAIVTKHAPVMKLIAASPQIQPYLSNMMVESFITYGGAVTLAQVMAIDADFRQLPVSDWPKL